MSRNEHFRAGRVVEDINPLIRKHLGGAAVDDENYGTELPSHVYRVMSVEHLELTRRTGFHQSDERNNYSGQARNDSTMQEYWREQGREPDPEGTVAGRWVEAGYSHRAPSVAARIRVDPSVGWEPHPDVPDEYVRTMKPIPAEHIEAVTPPFQMLHGGNFRVWHDRRLDP